jgi:hypothetical protein
MGHCDGKRQAGPGGDVSALGLLPTTAADADGLTAPQPGDSADAPAWETAWIDLGGEG